MIQRLLGADGGLVSVVDEGSEAQADWENLRSPETYLGYEQAQNFAGDAAYARPHEHVVPEPLNLNEWALGGSWTIGPGHSTANEPGGRLAFRFHGRDVNLVMGPPARGESVPFHVLVDGEPLGEARGLDVDEDGRGTLSQQRLHQLIREPGSIRDRTFEVVFETPGAEAYCFTFG